MTTTTIQHVKVPSHSTVANALNKKKTPPNQGGDRERVCVFVEGGGGVVVVVTANTVIAYSSCNKHVWQNRTVDFEIPRKKKADRAGAVDQSVRSPRSHFPSAAPSKLCIFCVIFIVLSE